MNVTGTVDGNSITGYVRALRRTQQLCNPMQIATLTLSTSFPNSISPAQQVVLYENGTKVFTGYVVKITRDRPSYDWVLEAHDVYTKCVNYFIDFVFTVGHDANDQPIRNYQPQSTNYWIGYLCGLAGVGYTSTGGTGTVPQGVQIGMRTIHESLQDIIAYSSQYVRANADGELRFERIVRNVANHTLSSNITVEDTTSDEWTRNVVKVYGYASTTHRILAIASTTIPGIIPDRITAVGAPMIQTDAEASRVADYLLSELGDLTHIVTAKIDGDPSIHIGQAARIIYDVTDRTDAITSVTHATNEREGYTTEVTIGERCPRISGWSRISPLIYAGTTRFGVYISRDGGHNWAEFNTGLPAGTKYVRRIGANALEEAMAIVNGSLYYTDGTNPWAIRSLPAPINSAGDVPAPGHGSLIAVDALGGAGSFAVMTVNPRTSGSAIQECRTWVYNCQSTGSAPSSWQSVELVNDIISSGSYSSGSEWHVIGIDMRSTLGTPNVVASSGSVYALVPGGVIIYQGDETRTNDYTQGFSQRVCTDASLGIGLRSWWVDSIASTGSTIRFTIKARTDTGLFRDNLFMYGSFYGGGAQYAGKDINDYWTWDFQSDFSWDATNNPLVPPFYWTTVVELSTEFSVGTIPQMFSGQTIWFNLFYSPWHTISQSSITMGEPCGEDHIVDTSPYGDTYHRLGHGGASDPATPYPIKSVLQGGFIEVV